MIKPKTKILRKFISSHPKTKGCFMEVREWKPEDLPSYVKKFDILRIFIKSNNGVTVDCFVYPDELLEIGELCVSAYGNYIRDKAQKTKGGLNSSQP